MRKDLIKTEKTIRTVLLLTLIAYVIFVLCFTVFCRESTPEASCYQGELFWSVRGAIANPTGNLPSEILFNCLMLIPVGFLLAWVLSPCIFAEGMPTRSELKIFIITTVAGFLLTCTIEVLQLVLHKGLFEYDDIIYNTFGTIVGYLIYRISRPAIERAVADRLTHND